MSLDWWQWYLLIGLLNYLHFAFTQKIWRLEDVPLVDVLFEWGFFVLLWPVQLAYFVVLRVRTWWAETWGADEDPAYRQDWWT